MVGKPVNNIFLSASIPIRERHPRYFDSADIIAIRDAVRALATVVIPKSNLIWGGHPAITPLIRYVLGRMDANVAKHVTLYQSAFFSDSFPLDNDAFERKQIVPAGPDLETSLSAMRQSMIARNKFRAGIFIGGMDGVEEEFRLFRDTHPGAVLLPVASTGAAARLIYDNHAERFDSRLKNDFAYMAMFRDLLRDFI
jgi:hypothetical protein